MKKNNFILPILLLCLFMTTGLFAQPNITLWRVDKFHNESDEGDHDHGTKDFWDCGGLYYFVHEGEDIDLKISIKNEGNEDLILQLPLELSAGTEEVYQITKQPDNDVLGPGEEAGFILTYVAPDVYDGSYDGSISIASNDPAKSRCGFTFTSGGGETDICVCTKDAMGNISKETIIADDRFFDIPQNSYNIGLGNCSEYEDEVCVTDDEASCRYLPFFSQLYTTGDRLIFINVTGFGDVFFPTDGLVDFPATLSIKLADGYCPCELETEPACIVTDDLPECNMQPTANLREEHQIEVRNENLCPGDEIEVGAVLCSSLSPVFRSPERNIHTRGIDDYEYEWIIDGFGTVTPAGDGSTATISDWKNEDVLILKTTDTETGCIDVTSRDLRTSCSSSASIYAPEGGCEGGSVTLCFAPFGLALRNQPTTRSDEVVLWETDGEGVFSNPREIRGDSCISFSGGLPGDRIVASLINDTETDCPLTNTVIFFGEINCTFFATENLITQREDGEVQLDDPCSCDDPMNYTGAGDVTFFHDILTIEYPGNDGFTADITNRVGWYDDMETEQTADLMVTDGGPMDLDGEANSEIQLTFYHPAGSAMTADIEVNNDTFPFTSSVCQECTTTVIPTMGQWGVIILTFLSLIIGIVVLRESQIEEMQRT